MEKTEKDSSHDDPVQVKAAKDYQAKEKDHTSEESYQDISMLQKAETEIIKMCQARHFWKEVKAVNAGNRVSSTSSIHQLDPFLDKDGVLRMGWRLLKSNLSYELKHPVFIPKNCTMS